MSSPERHTDASLSGRKLPPFDGILYRAATLRAEHLARYVPGTIVTEPGYVSATPDAATEFSGNVEFVIYSRSARNVSLFAPQPTEPEMLFRAGTSFLVRSVDPLPGRPDPDAARVVLEEVETDGRLFVMLDRVDEGPPELIGQLPLICELIALSDARGPAFLARTGTSIYYLPPDGPPTSPATVPGAVFPAANFDIGRVHPNLIRRAPNGQKAIALPGFVLAPRDPGATIEVNTRNSTVNVYYIIDPAQLSLETFDIAAVYFAAVAHVDSVLRPAQPGGNTEADGVVAEPDTRAEIAEQEVVEVEPQPMVDGVETELPPPAFVKLGSELTTTFGAETLIGMITVPRSRLEAAIGHTFDLAVNDSVAALILRMTGSRTIAVLGPPDPTTTTFSLQQRERDDPDATITQFRELTGLDESTVVAATQWRTPPVNTTPSVPDTDDTAEPTPEHEPTPHPQLTWQLSDYVGTAIFPEVDERAEAAARRNPDSVVPYYDPALPAGTTPEPHNLMGGRVVDADGVFTGGLSVNPDFVPLPATAGMSFTSYFELVLWRTLRGFNTIGEFVAALDEAELTIAASRQNPTAPALIAEPDGRQVLAAYTSPGFVPGNLAPRMRRTLSGRELLRSLSGRSADTIRFNPNDKLASDLSVATVLAWWAEWDQSRHPPAAETPPPTPEPRPAPAADTTVPAAARVLVIGLDPTTFPDWDPLPVRRAIARGQDRFDELGITADYCLTALDDSTEDTITRALTAHNYTCVVVGAGIRTYEPLLELFEEVINLVRRHSPNAAIAFDTTPEDCVDAAIRQLG